MKKAITILAVLIVLVSAVFATTLPDDGSSETHKITLKTTIANVLPKFRLTGVAAVGESSNTAETNSNSADFTKDAEYGTVAAPITLNVQDISVENIDVTFTASLLNAAKTGGKYTLSFTAGNFTNVWKVNPDTGVVTQDNTIAPSTTTVPALAKATTGAAKTGLTIGDPSNGSIAVVFNGKECEAGNIATYRVVYDKDDNVIDNNGTGYTADVTMTITYDR